MSFQTNKKTLNFDEHILINAICSKTGYIIKSNISVAQQHTELSLSSTHGEVLLAYHYTSLINRQRHNNK